MKKIVISFFGHRELSDFEKNLAEKRLYENLRRFARDAINLQQQIVCYCGGYGDFDLLVSKTLDRIKQEFWEERFFSLEKCFVTPVVGDEFKKRNEAMLEFYDRVIYPPVEKTPFERALEKRNAWVVENCDLAVCFVLRPCGNAFSAMRYAREVMIRGSVINLAEKIF